MKVLLLGGAGLLGSALRATVPPGVQVDAPPRAMLDATDVDALDRALDASRPACPTPSASTKPITVPSASGQ